MAETPASASASGTGTTTTKGPVGGHLTKKQRKEQFEALDALKTQLDVSVSLARSKVASWLNPEGFSDDEEDTSTNSSGFVGSAAIKPRQPGLGLGAKYLSHKDQMRHVPLNAFESKLKRQLTGGVVGAELVRAEQAEKNALPDKYMEHKLMMAAKRKELQEQAEDEEDSRTRNITGFGSGSSGLGAGTGVGVGGVVPKAGGRGGVSTVAASMGGLKKKNKEAKYQAAVHPAAIKAAAAAAASGSLESATSTTAAPTKPAPSSGGGGNKKRPTDFFSTYMDERAVKMAKKKKKTQGKVDPDDD
ncbi:hypothetical protein EC957_001752 [Mortierella hygrophila]|uniref:Uncharacterized protein n=1 Tax=Mortierella hygrophila TaxID=979708 RepID=A0A9P6K259_9FUNG|nr:hypothetical protein EC957_001752 [Mortierella hygrophila]